MTDIVIRAYNVNDGVLSLWGCKRLPFAQLGYHRYVDSMKNGDMLRSIMSNAKNIVILLWFQHVGPSWAIISIELQWSTLPNTPFALLQFLFYY